MSPGRRADDDRVRAAARPPAAAPPARPRHARDRAVADRRRGSRRRGRARARRSRPSAPRRPARALRRPARPRAASARTRVRCAAARAAGPASPVTRVAVRRAQRQRDGEQRPALGRVAERDLAAVQLDELAHDRQAEAGAGAGWSGRRRRGPSGSGRRPARGARAGRPGRSRPTLSAAAPSPRRSAQRTARRTGAWRIALASRLETIRLTRSTSKRAGERVRRLDREARSRGRRPAARTARRPSGPPARDRRRRASSRASPWSALTCSSMSLICSSALSAASRMLTICARVVRVAGSGGSSCSERVIDDLQRRAQVVRELAEQPLAVVVHAREALVSADSSAFWRASRCSTRLRSVIVRPSATMNATCPSRPRSGRSSRSSVPARSRRPRSATSTSKRANRPSAAARSPPARAHGARPGRPPPWRRPQRQPDDLGAVHAAGDQRRRVDVQHVAARSSSAMKLDDFACATCAISRRVSGSSGTRRARPVAGAAPRPRPTTLAMGRDVRVSCEIFALTGPVAGRLGSEPSERLAAYRHRRRRHREHSSNFRGTSPKGATPLGVSPANAVLLDRLRGELPAAAFRSRVSGRSGPAARVGAARSAAAPPRGPAAGRRRPCGSARRASRRRRPGGS